MHFLPRNSIGICVIYKDSIMFFYYFEISSFLENGFGRTTKKILFFLREICLSREALFEILAKDTEEHLQGEKSRSSPFRC